MSDKPQFVIINTFDQPCRRMICQLVGTHYYYMNQATDHRLRGFKMLGDGATPLGEFGFDCKTDEHMAHFTKARPSTARYEDGGLRRWQDTIEDFSLPLLKEEDVA